jgi:RHO1 GDP-GTP exchange protein 1/2
LKQTPDDCSDKHEIPKVVTLIREFLAEVNRETGRTENRFNLLQLEQQLLFRPGEQVVRTSNTDLMFVLIVDVRH